MSLVDHLHKFFTDNDLKNWPSSRSVMILRRDGQVLFRYPNVRKEDSSLGVLMCGSWQAVLALSGLVEDNPEEKRFRLSFDTSDTGIFMLPFQMQDTDLYMGVLYREEINPAKLKNRLRKLRDDLDRYLGNLTSLKKVDKTVSFEDITDDEIDKMFSHIGC